MPSPSLRQTIGTFSVSAGSSSITPSVATLAGSAIVVRFLGGWSVSPPAPTLSDSAGNFYNQLAYNVVLSARYQSIFAAFNCAVLSTSATITLTVPSQFAYGAACVIEEWVDATGYEGPVGNSTNLSQVGPLTTTIALDTLYALLNTLGQGFTPTAGYTGLTRATAAPSGDTLDGEYLVVSATGLYTPTWTNPPVPFGAVAILIALSSGAPRTPGTPTLSTTSTPLSITASWARPGGLSASSQRVQRSLNGSTWATIATVAGTVQSYIDTGVLANTLYYYRIEAVNAAGTTDGASASLTSAANVMSPLSLAPTENPLAIAMSWTALAAATGYIPQRSTDGSTWGNLAASQTGTSYTDSSVVAGTLYYYRVQGVSGAGTFYSPTMPLYAPGPVAPAAPVLALDPYGLGGPQVAVMWTPSQGTVTPKLTYAVDRSADHVTWTRAASGIVGCVYADENVPSAGTWYYRVAAEDSLYSNPGPYGSILVPILAPAGLSVLQTVGSVNIVLAWSTVATVVSWTVERSTNGVTWGNLVTGQAAATLTYTDTTANAYTRYWYRVTAVNASGSARGKAASIVPVPTVALSAGPHFIENGVDISANVDVHNAQVHTQVGNQGDAANIQWVNKLGLGELFKEVDIFDGPTLFFSGSVYDVQQSSEAVNLQVAALVAQGPFSLFTAAFPSETFEQQSAGYIIASLIARYVPGLTVNNVQAGPLIASVAFNRSDLASAIRQLIGDVFSTVSAVNFYVDANWDVHLEFGSSLPAANFVLTDANPLTGSYP